MRSIRFALLALVAVACKDSTRPPQPAQITMTPGGLQFDALSQRKLVTAIVRDADGGEIRNAPVAWTASPVVRVVPLKDTLDRVRLVAQALGSGTVTASIGEISHTIAIEVVQSPSSLDIGLAVTEAPVGTTVPAPVQVRVRDPLGSPVRDVSVQLIASGGGTVTPATVTTGSDGTAEAQWTLGTTSGDQRIHGQAGAAKNFVAITARPAAPAALLKLAGDAQTAWTDAPVDVTPLVQVVDPYGNGVPGVQVDFTPSAGQVQFASTTSTHDGTATAGRWTLGSAPGQMTLTAAVASIAPASFTIDAVAGGALVTIQSVAGDRQIGTEGTPLAIAPAIRLVDTLGAPQANRRVDFQVRTGGGSVSELTATTTAEGIAAVQWTVGPVAGPNELTVRVADGPATNNGVAFRATGCTGGSGAYVINVCFSTPMSTSQRAAFVNAAARWSAIITADVPDLDIDLPSPGCGAGLNPIRSRIDDLVIFAAVQGIDGPGQILGSAGWCYTRTEGLPLLGSMRFDLADVQMMESAGRFEAVIMHEIGHVLGIGTLWVRSGFLQNPSIPGQAGQDTHFNGVHAVAGFDQIGGLTYTIGAKVPVENGMGAGSINSHWRESVLANELMTPVINVGANPLTVLTALSLRDLGYEVDPARADPSVYSDIHADRRAAPAFLLFDDVDEGPRYAIDRTGRVRRLH